MQYVHGLNGLMGVLWQTRQSLKDSKKPDRCLDTLKMQWGQGIMDLMNVDLQIIGQPSSEPSTLFLGNHISYLDIPLLMSCVDRISFVAKKELRNWPLFGYGAKKMDTVFVKRSSADSRNSAKQSVQKAINDGKRVVIFPSGTTTIDGNKDWRKGAFDIAETTQCRVQPFRLAYSPLREVAYIDKDFFPTHVIRLGRHPIIHARLEFHEPIKVENAVLDCTHWQQWANSSDGTLSL